MSDMKMPEEKMGTELDFFILSDDKGKDTKFEVVGTCVYKKKTYYALVNPEECEEGEFEEYLVIRADKNAQGEEEYSFIDDDDEFDDVADIFDDMFTTEIDCDN